MAPNHKFSNDPLMHLSARLDHLQRQLSLLAGPRYSSATILNKDIDYYADDSFDGQIAIDPRDDTFKYRSNGTWITLSTVRPAEFDIKVFTDTTINTIGDGKFIFAVPRSIHGYHLSYVTAYVTTVSSSGLPTVQIRNTTTSVDMLSTRVTIDVGEKDSRYAATPAIINTANDDVSWADQLAIDVDVAGTGAKGLGLILEFSQ